eukprot:364627-Chlamydomonas_euryale.AAC.1
MAHAGQALIGRSHGARHSCGGTGAGLVRLRASEAAVAPRSLRAMASQSQPDAARGRRMPRQPEQLNDPAKIGATGVSTVQVLVLSLIHISEPTRRS